MGHIIYDPETGEYIDAETGEVLDIEYVGGLKAVKTEIENIHWRKTSMWVHDNGLFTVIDDKHINTRNMVKKLSKLSQAKKLAIMNKRLRVGKNQRRLVEVITYTNNVCKKLGLPKSVAETACILIKKYASKLTHGIASKHTRKIVALAILASARVHKLTLTIDEVAKAVGLKGNTSLIKTGMDIGLKPVHQDTLLAIQDLWSRHLPKEYLLTALKFAKKLMEDPRFTGISRKTLTATIAYILLKNFNNTKQDDISRKLGITNVSIRETMKKIFDRHDIVVEVE